MKWYDDVEVNFKENWEAIVTNEDGSLNEDAVKNELSDYIFIMEQVLYVYDKFGTSSKLLTYGHEIVRDIETRYISKDIASSDIEDMLVFAKENGTSIDELLDEIKEYLK